ncbi:MAG: peptidoglycan-associated lipoprotein Pal [Geminicoccaceae bacterium]|jgi:peptidoglycan-associated lipoprotein|nr:peptidoglycan-associated lipoprotein Pal [Geminicoccaceae bacterium]HRY23315.1 peptidoglycan-associated lipoprotein Pal [Geminicoccaceae bacterium]
MRPLFAILPAALLLLAACSSTPEDTLGSDEQAGGATSSVDGAYGAGGAPTELGDGSSTVIVEEDLFASGAPGSQQDFEINVGDRVFFGFDSTTLDDDARATLDRQASWLFQYPATSVTIEGHADERGTREYNLALGERRATAVKNYLVALGVTPDRLLTISYGEERPVDPGRDETAYAQNRRAVTVINLVN